jgi:hypothetical protein
VIDEDAQAFARDWLAHPARAWAEVPYKRGRGAIFKALRIDPTEPLAGYATNAFRILETGEGEAWMAGAVGCPPSFNISAVLSWDHTAIRDIILWNPRTGALRVLGEPDPTLIMPDADDGRVTVFGEGFAFFRAWADRRAENGTRIVAALRSRHAAITSEPADGGLPGVLAIGDLNRMPWTLVGATTLVAGPGVDAAKLRSAIFHAARLPRVEERLAA